MRQAWKPDWAASAFWIAAGGIGVRAASGTLVHDRRQAARWSTTADSLRLAAVAATFALLLACPTALFLFRSRSRFHGVLAVAAVAPLLVSGTARVIGWLAIRGGDGIVNAALAGIGPPRQALINNWVGVQVGLMESVMPYTVLALLSGSCWPSC